MRFAANYDYPVAPSQVSELMRDRDYLLAAAGAAGAEASQAEVADGPDGVFTVTIRATMPSGRFPAAVQALLPQGLELRQALVWEPASADGAQQATMAGTIAGAPVHLSGLVLLSPTATGSRAEFAGEVRAQLPLFGRSVEEAAVPAVVKVLDAQHRVALDWLGPPN